MSDKIEVYKYPVQYRTIAVAAPILIILASAGVTFVSWQSLNSNNWVNEAGQTVFPGVFWFAALGGILLATFFAACIHITYPTIYKRQDGFRVETLLFSSRWFTWDEISKVSLPPSNLVTQIYGVGVRELNPIFWAIGLSRGMFAPGFLIHPRMIDGGKLLRTMIKERPDLFNS